MDKGQQESSEAEKSQKARNYVQEAINRSSYKELSDLKKLIEKSDKYDKSQKVEFLKIVDEKMAEITKDITPSPKAETPTVQVE